MPERTSDPQLDEVNDLSPQVDESASGSVDVSMLAGAIVQAVNAAQGPRKPTLSEYLTQRSVHRDKPQLTRRVYQNGMLLTRRQLTADAIHMLNEIRPGIYADGMLQVVPLREGATSMSFDIRYQNKSVDDRMAVKAKFQTFEHMLAAILREQSVAA